MKEFVYTVSFKNKIISGGLYTSTVKAKNITDASKKIKKEYKEEWKSGNLYISELLEMD